MITANSDYKEITDQIVTIDALQERIRTGRVAILRGNGKNIIVGEGCLIKVNTSIGTNHNQRFDEEVEKLQRITSCDYSPDIIMDLSISNTKNY